MDMQNPEERQNRLKKLAEIDCLPFDLDFFRELGFEFGLDWDGQLQIGWPESLSSEDVAKLILNFENGIRKRLWFEGQKAKRILVGGPLNGNPYREPYYPNQPLYYHTGYRQWHVYRIKSWDDPRAWYIGQATSKPKAKSLVR